VRGREEVDDEFVYARMPFAEIGTSGEKNGLLQFTTYMHASLDTPLVHRSAKRESCMYVTPFLVSLSVKDPPSSVKRMCMCESYVKRLLWI
jgi:hypothetical protein